MSTELIPTNEYERILGIVNQACSNTDLMVIDDETYSTVAEYRAIAKRALRDVEEARKSLTSKLDDQKKKIMAFFKATFSDRLDNFEKQALLELTRYDKEQREKREAEQRALEEKLKAEAKAKAEAAAAAAMKENKPQLAQMIVEQAKTEVVAVPQLEKAKPLPWTGMSYRDSWEFEIVDPKAIPREFLVPDLKALGALVKAQKDKCAITGIRVFNKQIPVQRV